MPLHLLGRKTLECKGFTKITLLHVNSRELLPLSRRNPAAKVTFARCSHPAAQPESLARSAGCDREDPRPQGSPRSGRGHRVRKAPRESGARAAPGRPRSAARAQSCAAPSRPPHLASAAAGARGSGQHNAPGPRPGRLEHVTPRLSSKQLAVPSSPPPSPPLGSRRCPWPTPSPPLRNPGGGGGGDAGPREVGGRGLGGGEKSRGARRGVEGRQLLK